MNNQPLVHRELVDVYRSQEGRERERRRDRRKEVRQRRKEWEWLILWHFRVGNRKLESALAFSGSQTLDKSLHLSQLSVLIYKMERRALSIDECDD